MLTAVNFGQIVPLRHQFPCTNRIELKFSMGWWDPPYSWKNQRGDKNKKNIAKICSHWWSLMGRGGGVEKLFLNRVVGMVRIFMYFSIREIVEHLQHKRTPSGDAFFNKYVKILK